MGCHGLFGECTYQTGDRKASNNAKENRGTSKSYRKGKKNIFKEMASLLDINVGLRRNRLKTSEVRSLCLIQFLEAI